MVKSKGSHHSERVSGSVGPLTHRLYRGMETISRHRSPTRVKFRQPSISSPSNIPGCWSRYVASQGYVLSSAVPPFFLVSLADLCNGYGTLIQPTSALRCRWYPSDPLHNNQPYLLPDGINDTHYTVPSSTTINAPLDIWIVAADIGTPTVNRTLLSLHSVLARYLVCTVDPVQTYRWLTPNAEGLAPWSDATVKVWRIVFTGSTVQIYWNGIPQKAPTALASFSSDNLRLFARFDVTQFYNKPLFEIAFWRRILNPVEAKFLLSYYRLTFNI